MSPDISAGELGATFSIYISPPHILCGVKNINTRIRNVIKKLKNEPMEKIMIFLILNVLENLSFLSGVSIDGNFT